MVVMIWLLTKTSNISKAKVKESLVVTYFQIRPLFRRKILICIFSTFDKLNLGLYIFEARCKKWAKLIVVNSKPIIGRRFVYHVMNAYLENSITNVVRFSEQM